MKEAFKHISWFFKQEWKKYVVCAILLFIVSVLPVFPARILGTAIDEIANGTITKDALFLYIGLLFLIPLVTYILPLYNELFRSYFILST